MAVCASVRSAPVVRQLEKLHLGHLRRGLLLVARIDDVGCAARVSHVLAVILLEYQVIVAEVYLGAHVLHRLFRLGSAAPVPKSEDLHVWIVIPLIQFLSRVP